MTKNYTPYPTSNPRATTARNVRRTACTLAVVSLGFLAACASDAAQDDASTTDAPEADSVETDAPETDSVETDVPETDPVVSDVPETDSVETSASTDAGPTETAGEEEEVGAFDLEKGDCIAEPTGDMVTEVTVVDCTEPHDAELYHVFEIDGDEYPGDEAVATATDDGCLAEFEPFIGIAYEDSLWDITSLFPTEESWNGLDDREVLCGVRLVSGEQATSSASGAAE